MVPATGEAEAEESLEPGRQGLQWAKIMPLHFILGDRTRLSFKKQERGVLPKFSSAQPVELFALTQACELSKDKL